MYLPKSVDIANKRRWQTAWTVFASVMHLRPVCALPSDCPNSFALQRWAMGFLFGYGACRLGTRSLFARGLFYITCVTSQTLFEPRIPD